MKVFAALASLLMFLFSAQVFAYEGEDDEDAQDLAAFEEYAAFSSGTECRTLGTSMYVDSNGRGFIGCDIQVRGGSFDLSSSYCISEHTKRKEFLKPDGYGRAGQYYATLTGLDPRERVAVFIYSGGQRILCGILNGK